MNSKERRELRPQIPDYITPKFVKDYVDYLRAISGDDEVAHVEEDNLYYIILEAIAEGRCEDVDECAREAIESIHLEFARHCS